MDVRSIHTPSFPVLTPSQGTRKEQSPVPENTPAKESTGTESTRHPVLTAEEQRYFESAFPCFRERVIRFADVQRWRGQSRSLPRGRSSTERCDHEDRSGTHIDAEYPSGQQEWPDRQDAQGHAGVVRGDPAAGHHRCEHPPDRGGEGGRQDGGWRSGRSARGHDRRGKGTEQVSISSWRSGTRRSTPTAKS